MKKLLSLLSLLTISGSAVPTTIAASSYQKEETIKNSDTNYSQKNNWENLKRYKRQQNPKISREILQLTDKLIIDSDNPNEYISSSRIILQSLERLMILIPVINVGDENEDSIIYTLNPENYGYFRLPVEIRAIDLQTQQSYRRNLELVLRTDNLYLQGFISNNNYYHFNFNNVDMRRQPQSVRNGSVPLLTQIEGFESHQLNRIGPDYRDLLPESNNNINWNNIHSSFLYLTNNINSNEERLGDLATSLGRVIFSTAEAIRFRNIYNIMYTDIINNNHNVSLTFRDDEIYQILVSWGVESRQYRSLLFNEQNRYQGFERWYGIDLFIHNILGDSEFSFINDLTPIDIITEYLTHFNTRVLLGVALPLTFGIITSNCNKNVRSFGTTEFENPFWKEQLCDFEPQIKKIDGKIEVIKTLNEDIKSKNLKSGDIFVGTTKGIYLILENGTTLKADNIDNVEVTSIKEFDNGNFYFSTNNEEVYFLNTKFLNNEYILAEKLLNAKSYNLEKEIKFYYDENENEKTIVNDWGKNTHSNLIYKNFNFNKISPFSYKKIEFLGSKKNFKLSRISWGNNPFYAYKPLNYFNGVETNDYIINHKTLNNDDVKLDNCKFDVQNWRRTNSPVSNVEWYIYVGLTAYEEYPNSHFLQLLSIQFAERHGGGDNGGIFTGIGNGIRLYNDDDNNDNYAYFSARESENDNLLIQYSQALYSEAITYFEYYWSKFKEYLNYFTIENIYSYLKNF